MRSGDGDRILDARWLGRLPYDDALALQERLVAARRAGAAPDTLLLLEHPPVITIGRGGNAAHVLIDAADRAARGIELRETGRGGDVTYHGPGQLVGYPIVALPPERRDAHRYLRDLEEALIRTVAEFGIEAGRAAGRTGVWVEDGKLAAIGVRLSSGWITSHGYALNVNTDLDNFAAIVPCGIRDHAVTSMARILGREIPVTVVAERAVARTAEQLGLRLAGPLAARVVLTGPRERATA